MATSNQDLGPTSRVYFIEAVGLGLVKIGYARDVGERMRKLRPGCPAPLRLLGTLPGGIREERALHCDLHKARAQGEWFRFGPALDAILATVEKPVIKPAKAGHRRKKDPRTAEEVAAVMSRIFRQRHPERADQIAARL